MTMHQCTCRICGNGFPSVIVSADNCGRHGVNSRGRGNGIPPGGDYRVEKSCLPVAVMMAGGVAALIALVAEGVSRTL